ncbi:MAG: HyaD/HybD family hydrogenase maturation endopeptidase [Acidobacteriia bacterium]|nr:HyaD/HybD family hydrogenase maturation endopeptidase [Terriglobia bacterium]
MSAPRTASTVVLGLGNVIHSDDGAGVHAVQRLKEAPDIPEDVALIEGGTLGLALLPYLWDAVRILVLDAVDVGQPAGTVVCLSWDEIRRLRGSGSVHLVGLADLLGALQLVANPPQEIILLGVQPASTDWGTELSQEVQVAIPQLVTTALELLCRWSQPLEQAAS